MKIRHQNTSKMSSWNQKNYNPQTNLSNLSSFIMEISQLSQIKHCIHRKKKREEEPLFFSNEKKNPHFPPSPKFEKNPFLLKVRSLLFLIFLPLKPKQNVDHRTRISCCVLQLHPTQSHFLFPFCVLPILHTLFPSCLWTKIVASSLVGLRDSRSGSRVWLWWMIVSCLVVKGRNVWLGEIHNGENVKRRKCNHKRRICYGYGLAPYRNKLGIRLELTG